MKNYTTTSFNYANLNTVPGTWASPTSDPSSRAFAGTERRRASENVDLAFRKIITAHIRKLFKRFFLEMKVHHFPEAYFILFILKGVGWGIFQNFQKFTSLR